MRCWIENGMEKMDKTAESDTSFKEKAQHLEEENRKLRKKIERLKKTMEITSRHGDVVTCELEEKVEASIKEIEDRVRLISETIPVPIIISQMALNGKVLYANEHMCNVFGFSSDDFMKFGASDLYEKPQDLEIFIKKMNEQGRVNNLEMKFRKKDGQTMWGALFSQRLNFKNEICVLSVIYDLTERRNAEEEIRHLREELNQKEIKHLIFTLGNAEYGIELLKIREIVNMMPIIPVMDVPRYIKGVINLRGRMIPVTDLRLRLGLEATAYTGRTCIIVAETGNAESSSMIGIIVDTVTEIRGFRARDIESPRGLGNETRDGFIAGIAKSDSGMKILIQPERICL